METSLFVEEGHTAPEWVCGSHLDESRACYGTGAAACGSWSARSAPARILQAHSRGNSEMSLGSIELLIILAFILLI